MYALTKIILKNGYYYIGDVLSETDTNLTLKDKKEKIVTLAKDQIAVREDSA